MHVLKGIKMVSDSKSIYYAIFYEKELFEAVWCC